MNLLSLVSLRLDNICQIKRKWYYSSGWKNLQSKQGLSKQGLQPWAAPVRGLCRLQQGRPQLASAQIKQLLIHGRRPRHTRDAHAVMPPQNLSISSSAHHVPYYSYCISSLSFLHDIYHLQFFTYKIMLVLFWVKHFYLWSSIWKFCIYSKVLNSRLSHLAFYVQKLAIAGYSGS
jgi:hypothetical protein